jgi:hypothetical protein
MNSNPEGEPKKQIEMVLRGRDMFYLSRGVFALMHSEMQVRELHNITEEIETAAFRWAMKIYEMAFRMNRIDNRLPEAVDVLMFACEELGCFMQVHCKTLAEVTYEECLKVVKDTIGLILESVVSTSQKFDRFRKLQDEGTAL